MPSQPKNITKKLSDVTKTNIKPVNKDKYPIKREACGSVSIYSVEYKCTSDDTLQTTSNIVALIESK